jgi:hypothetical protein
MNHIIIYRHTSHLYRISTEGRNRPAPSIGSPMLIWHLGIWRKYNHPTGAGAAQPHDFYIDDFESNSRKFYEEVFGFLDALQKRGLREGDPVQPFRLEKIALEGYANEDEGIRDEDEGTRQGDEGIRDEDAAEQKKKKLHRFPVFAPQSASFTLWWRDNAKNGIANSRIRKTDPDVDHALRVFVQFQGFQDHITLTFYIDGCQLFTGRQILKREDVEANLLGERRTRLLNHLDAIRSSSFDRIVSGAVDLPNSDRSVDSEVETALKAAADYLFVGIWEEFMRAFGFRTRAQDEKDPEDGSRFLDEGLIFVNQRGLMMSVRGLETEDDEERLKLINGLKARNKIKVEDEQVPPETPDWRQLGRSASATLGPVDVFDTKSGEPETLLKSFWPFLCQMTEHAARKDWVGCGILDWRALFMSTLGSRVEPGGYWQTLAPERFFIVTKGEPHREQIGRMVERLVSLETMRAIAFKNLGTTQNASLHLRTLTMALDDILKQWAVERKDIQKPWDKVRKELRHHPGRGEVFERLRKEDIVEEERFYDRLSALNAKYETQLIDIAASLETMGRGGSGHLAHSIDEASYYIGEFDRMVPTLEIGNIAGWINYAQFADRGMRPTFNMIKNTGQRLVAAQDRLKALTDVVQVSALIVQSDATRRNTDTLREIASNQHLLNEYLLFLRSKMGRILFVLLGIAIFTASVIKVWEGVMAAAGWIGPAVEWIRPHLHL